MIIQQCGVLCYESLIQIFTQKSQVNVTSDIDVSTVSCEIDKDDCYRSFIHRAAIPLSNIFQDTFQLSWHQIFQRDQP